MVIGGQPFSLSQLGAPCTFKLSTTSRTHGYSATSGTVGLTTSAGCAWSVVNTNGWITITSALNGTGGTTVTYDVAANPNGIERSGVVLIGGQALALTQRAPTCTYVFAPTVANHPATADSGTTTVTTLTGCAWSVVNTNTWITITSALDNTSSGALNYTVEANPEYTARSGFLTVAGQAFQVNQAGLDCTYAIAPASADHGAGTETGAVTVTAGAGCAWSVVNPSAWVTIDSGASGTGNGSVNYTVATNPDMTPRSTVLSIAGQSFTINQAAAPCTYTLSPPDRTHGYGATSDSISLTAGTECDWTIVNTNDWITITSAASGTGNAEITYDVAANPDAVERVGVLVIGDAALTLTQHATPCAYTLTPAAGSHGADADNGSVDVTTPSGCSWTVVNTNTWITITSSLDNTDNGTVAYTVDANPSHLSRTGNLTIGDEVFPVMQAGIPCAYALAPVSADHGEGAEAGQVGVTTDAECSWSVENTNAWITIDAGASGTGNGTVNYSVGANPSLSPRTGFVTISGELFTINQAGATCAYDLSPIDRTHGYGASTGLVSVATTSECAWTIVNTNDWIAINSPLSGTGNADIGYSVDANPAYSLRTGVVLIGGQPFTLSQLGQVCTYKVSPSTRTHGYGATSDTFSLTADSACSWTIINTNDWITITSSPNGTGTSTINYDVASNPSSSERIGTVVIEGETLTLTQRARPCSYSISPTDRVHGFAATEGQISVTAVLGCPWTVVTTNDWITITSATTGTGDGSVNYSLSENTGALDRAGVVVVGDQPFTLTQRGAFCVYETSPTNLVLGAEATTAQMTVLTTATCTWGIINTNDWITITSGASGTGEGTVNFDVAANLDRTARTGNLTIEGDPLTVFVVAQTGAPCAYAIDPAAGNHGTGSENGTIAVTTSSDCAWTVVNTNSWITITSELSGNGNGSVSYTVEANSNVSARAGTLLIGDQLYPVSQTGIACTYALAPTEQSHGAGVENGSVAVTTTSECSWAVINTNDWITITSALTGTGNGTVDYTLTANPDFGARTGVFNVADETFTVTQAGVGCVYTLSPIDRTHGYGATTDLVSVATSSECAWTVVNTNAWISIQSATSGLGNADISYSVAANPNLEARLGVVVIGDQPFTLSQLGTPCTYKLSPSTRTHGYGAAGGTLTMTATAGCDWTVVNTNDWITITSGMTGSGSASITYTVAANPNGYERSGVVEADGQTMTLTQRAAPCTYSLLPTYADHSADAEAGMVMLTTLSGCSWTVVNTNDWIAITSDLEGTNSGMVTYTVTANPTTAARTGVLGIADTFFTVSQAGATCNYTLDPASASLSADAASDTIAVTTLAECEWTVVNTNDWITIDAGAGGTGSGSVSYTAAANPSAQPRTGVLVIADQNFTVTQAGVPCDFTLTPTSADYGVATDSGTISVSTASGCDWTVNNTNYWITITDGAAGTDSGTVSYDVAANLSGSARTGILVIGGQLFTVHQAGLVCNYTLSADAMIHGAGAENGSVDVVPDGGWALKTNSLGPVDFAARMEAAQRTVNGTETNVVFDGLVYDNSVNDLLVRFNPGTLEVGDEVILDGQAREITKFELEYWGENRNQANFVGTVEARVRFYANDGSDSASGYPTPQTVLYDSGWFGVSATTRATLIFEDFQVDAAVPLVASVPDSLTWTIQFRGMEASDAVGIDLFSPPVMGWNYPDFWERSGSGCNWTVDNSNDWITLLSDPNGSGGERVNYAVAANPTALERTGVLTVAGETFTVTQSGAACAYVLSPTSQVHGSGEETGTVALTTIPGCDWSVVNTNTWITITSAANGTDSGSVEYTVAANPTAIDRTGVLVIGEQAFTVTQVGAPCTYALSATGQTHGAGLETGVIGVTTLDGCDWTVSNPNSWITITAGASGNGSGTVNYSVAANPNGLPRTGMVTIADQTFTVEQAAAPCTFALAPANRPHGYEGGAGQFSVTTLNGCDWTVSNPNSWITITAGGSGTGNGNVSYSVDANPTAIARSGVLTVADQQFTVNQDGAPCTFAIAPEQRVHSHGAEAGEVLVTTIEGCDWTVINTNSWITISSGASGTGSGNVNYSVDANPNFTDRSGVFVIAGLPYAVTQLATPCTATLAPTERAHTAPADSGQISVTPVGNCDWTTVNTNSWITITAGASGTGNGTVAYSVTANEGPRVRTGVLVIAGQPFTISQTGIVCVYTVNPTSLIHGYGAESGTITVTTSSGCDWTAVSTNAWITISTGTNYLGNATVNYSVTANPSSNLRAGVLLIADKTVPLIQWGAPCTYAISPTEQAHGSGLENGSVHVTAVNDCTWFVENTNAWITITANANGVSSGDVQYAVAPNPTAIARSAVLTIAGQQYTVNQAGAPCTFMLTPDSRNHGYIEETGSINVTTITGCSWTVSNSNSWITILSSLNGTNNGSVSYRVAANPNGSARTGNLLIAGQAFAVSQSGAPCDFTLSATSASHGYQAANGLVTVTTLNGCDWTVVNTNSWITISSGANGTGSGNVNYSVGENLNANGRSGTVVIAGQTFDISQTGAPCTFALTPANRVHSDLVETGQVTVTTITGCTWTTDNTNDWIEIIAGTNGIGSGTVEYVVEANPTAIARTGMMTLAGQTFTIDQLGAACAFTLEPANGTSGYEGATGQVSVTTIPGCAWTAVSTNSWLAVSAGASGSGDGIVTFTVAANPIPAPRTGTLTIAGQAFPVTQDGAPCTFAIAPTNRLHGSGIEAGLVSVATSNECSWVTINSNSWITITAGASGLGSATLRYTTTDNYSPNARSGYLNIADNAYLVTQLGSPCTYTLLPTDRIVDYVSTTGQISVLTVSECSWTVVNTNDWIVFTGLTNGAGNGIINYTVQENQRPNDRIGGVDIAGQTFLLQQFGSPCTFAISATNQAFGYLSSTGQVGVTTLTNCPWTVVNTNPWISITSGASGTGNGAVNYTVGANPSHLVRSGVMTVAGKAYTVSQDGAPCTYGLTPSNRVHSSSAATGQISVTGVPGCPWTAVSTNAWITITAGASGTVPGTVNYSVAANPSPLMRTGVVAVAGLSFTVSQQGIPCTFDLSPSKRTHGYGGASSYVTLTTITDCPWTIINTNDWIIFTAGTNGVSSGPIEYTVLPNLSVNERSGVFIIGDQIFTMSQRAFAIAPTERVHGAGAETGSVDIITCGTCNWTAYTTNDWLAITSSTNGPGSTTLSYAVAANPTALTRVGELSMGGWSFVVTQVGADCSFTLNPASGSHGHTAEVGAISLTTLEGCSWTVSNTNSWITITAGANGTNSGTISYSVAANPTGLARIGNLYIAGQLFPVTQSGAPCTFVIAPTNRSHGEGQESAQVSVTAIDGCDWTAVSTNTWLTITSGASGTGNGTVNYTVAANPDPAERTGVLVIAGEPYTVTQARAFLSPVITGQPTDQTAVVGDTVTFSVGVSGSAPLSYQWRYNGAILPNGGGVSGATTPNLTLANVQAAQAGTYSVMVTNAAAGVTSVNAQLTVNIPPAISSQPQSRTVVAGGTATFTVTATGTAPLSYQWQFNGANLLNGTGVSGATTPSLTLANVQSARAGDYTVIVTNVAGSVASSAAHLTVNLPPSITTQPVSQTVLAGATVSFDVGAGGTEPLSYQWRLDGANLTDGIGVSGAATPRLTLLNVQAAQVGSYSVVVTNQHGTVTSASAALTLVADVETDWAARYDGTGNGADEAHAMVVDDAGNVYVTGVSVGESSGSDYLTVKYAPDGAKLWSARYNGLGNGYDAANSITVDDAGNVYVTGQSLGGNYDYATVKYGSEGNQLWVARFSFAGDDSACKVVVDSAGNVYVTGTTANDYNTVKYNASGAKLWSARFNGPAGNLDQAAGLAVDAMGNVYVTGGATGTTNGMDFTTVKYDSAGNVLWVATYSGPAVQTDMATAIALDATGNVIVTGSSWGTGTMADFATVKYDAAGHQLWAKRYDSPAHDQDEARALAIDAAGNVLVAGTVTTAANGRDWITIKYDAAGNKQWDIGYSGAGDDNATSLALDLAGNAFVAGSTETAGNTNYLVVKYTTQGNQAWTMSYDFAGLADVANAIAVANDGHVAVTGRSQAVATGDDFATVNFTQNRLPTILEQPRSVTVLTNESISFSVSATGLPPLAYQWRFNGTNLVNGGNVSGATMAYLSLGNVPLAQAGNYSVVVSNAAGSIVSSRARLSIVTMTMTPEITSPPASQNVALGGNVTFDVAATGTEPFTYQWQFNGADLVNGSGVSGATTAHLSLTGVQAAQAGAYTVVVSNAAGDTTSDEALLSVILPPEITSQPQGQTVAAGTMASFSVAASGTPPLNYQWRLNGNNLTDGTGVSGATTAQLTLANVQAGQAGAYSVVVNNAASSVTSEDAVLTVLLPPAITSQPQSRNVRVGATVSFSVAVSGTAPFSYQWQFGGADLANGATVSGATTAQLTLDTVQVDQTGAYSVRVSNTAGNVTSGAAQLTVTNAVLSLAEALDATNLVWTTGGNAVWLAQTNLTHDGEDATRSGMIEDNQQTWLETTVVGPGTLTFWWKVSSETNRDFLRFYAGGVEQTNISGDVDWEQQAFAIPAGSHVLWWVYVKDYGSAIGQDRGWVDQVEFTPAPIALNITASTDRVVLSWEAVPGKNYQVEYKDNLMEAQWKVLPGEVTLNGTTASLEQMLDGQPHRFYRVVEH